MTSTAPLSAGTKRAYQADEPHTATAQLSLDADKTPGDPVQQQTTSAAATSAFRNVSACNRCRVRKNKCDQRLPACNACEKANTRCVGFDPITKKEIPRSYVFYLEARLLYLEQVLIDNGVKFNPADAFEDGAHGVRDQAYPPTTGSASASGPLSSQLGSPQRSRKDDVMQEQEDEKISKIVSDIGMVSVQGASDRRYLGSTSGISFARVVLAAIKSSGPSAPGDRRKSRADNAPPKAAATVGGSSMRDSYFGLSTRPSISEAPFPSEELGARLVELYFEHANPQIPILHRVEFMELFHHAYSVDAGERTARELYLLNIVFAIGAGVIFGSSDADAGQDDDSASAQRARRLGEQQAQPEEYHASAIVHLGSFLSSPASVDNVDRSGSDLEDLQAVLLLAGFALLRPVAPGLWYIVGVAMRLAVDLGLHFEDGSNLDRPSRRASKEQPERSRRRLDSDERGKRQWVRDMRRRLWWCTYCFDRLVSTCVGRPFGITDSVITTEFPSLLEDKYITRGGIRDSSSVNEPTYKRVTHHYLRLRLLQSEILQVLQYQQAQQARALGANADNPSVHKDVPSPFLIQHRDFRTWRAHIDQRLWEWKESAPQKAQTGVSFSVQFLELNYWQAVIMLYRNSLSVPEPLAGETSPTEEVSTPTSMPTEDKEDQDLVFLKCAEAGQKTLKIYRQLHRKRLVNYTYLATHHLFMAGISFLYAVWHSPAVRSHLSIDDFDFTVLAATSVLGDLMEKCPPAKACRDAFDRMSKATVQMCMNTPGFRLGQSTDSAPTSNPATSPQPDPMVIDSKHHHREHYRRRQITNGRRPPPQFDMDLHELFPEDLDVSARPSRSLPRSSSVAQRVQQAQQRYGHQSHLRSDHSPKLSLQSTSHSRHGSTSLNSGSMSTSMQQGSPHMMTSGMNSTSYFSSVNQNSYNPDFVSGFPGLEFLSTLSQSQGQGQGDSSSGVRAPGSPMSQVQAGNGNNNNSTTSNSNSNGGLSPGLGFNFDFSTESPMEYGSGFDFGVGMGLEFSQQHGWNDPQGGFDYDGFFFGGGGGNTTGTTGGP